MRCSRSSLQVSQSEYEDDSSEYKEYNSECVDNNSEYKEYKSEYKDDNSEYNYEITTIQNKRIKNATGGCPDFDYRLSSKGITSL